MYCTNTKCIFYDGEECNFTKCICEEEDEFDGVGGR